MPMEWRRGTGPRASGRVLALPLVALVLLAGCVDGAGPLASAPEGEAQAAADGAATPAAEGAAATTAAAAPAVAPAKSARIVDRDVEAPEVFQVTAEALWDGRPSLGGVWVASPDTKDPERVVMRNTQNGKFVIGALFRRERDNPGPPLQISSDAADALGILAGQTVPISVTALRRDEAPVTAPDAGAPILNAAETVTAETVEAEAVAAATGAAIAAAPAKPAMGKAAPTVDPAAVAAATNTATSAPAAAAPAAPVAGGRRIQIGIFSVEANARRAAETVTKAGIAAEVRKEQSQGKTFWSVTASGSDASATLAKVKGLGFKDAYLLK